MEARKIGLYLGLVVMLAFMYIGLSFAYSKGLFGRVMFYLLNVVFIGAIFGIVEWKTKLLRNLFQEVKSHLPEKNRVPVQEAIKTLKEWYYEIAHERLKVTHHFDAPDGVYTIFTIISERGKLLTLRADMTKGVQWLKDGHFQPTAYDATDYYPAKKEKLYYNPKKPTTALEANIETIKDVLSPEFAEAYAIRHAVMGEKQEAQQSLPQAQPQVIEVPQKRGFFWQKQKTDEEEE